MKLALICELVLEIVKYTLLLHVLFGTEIRRKWMAGVSVVIWTILLFTGMVQTNDMRRISIVINAMVVVTLLVTAKEAIIRKVLYVVVAWIIAITLDSGIGMLVEILLSKAAYAQLRLEQRWMIFSLISICGLSLIYWIQKKRLLEKSKVFQRVAKVILYICIAIMMIALPATVTGLAYLGREINNPALTSKLQILTDIFLFSMIALAIFIIYVNNTNKRMKRYLEMEKTLKDTQKNYYEAMLAKEEDTRRFRHDVLNHLIALGELARQGEMKPVADYVEEIQGDIVKIQQKCYSIGNTIIDAFLNYYVQMLEEDVEVSVTGCLTQEIAISDVELCTIFSNLIKNSVEELKKNGEGKKYLKIKVSSGQQAFKIEISNSISREGEIQGELPETTKKDKKNHGIGLRNVTETVEKNEGIFEWKAADACFQAVVTLPLRRSI
ncbi:sensor histidine kinase [Roseburia sp. MSJ-14]|uniref:sensor histidine kinase n=1 Tax=Roseburia sp. MSJ-14 TaxID=2841514 RepID=UPI001C0FAD41|nr:GHKL domain-containing protein [Roseburia sp. MSJ-14]MBU5474120.1 GHKL domain-containing protein [Roseburia sp. MSJ-14]